jgi:hypothetical protein
MMAELSVWNLIYFESGFYCLVILLSVLKEKTVSLIKLLGAIN